MHAFVQVSDDLRIHYVSIGQGRPLVFIPGWTMDTGAFRENLGPLSADFRAIAYDPRSHGKSSRTESGHDYGQHAADLAAFLDELELRDVVLLGWSAGACAAYSYFERFGYGNVRAFVNIDQPPKAAREAPADWAINSREELAQFERFMASPQREEFARMAAPTMFLDPPADAAFVEEFVASSMSTPQPAASLLLREVNRSDYSEVAREVAGRLPVLHIVKEEHGEAARRWTEANAPQIELCVLGAHMMFLEFPAEFNAAVTRFLNARLPETAHR